MHNTAPNSFPAPSAGIALAHFLVASDVERSLRFYRDVLGGEVVREGAPAAVALANSWIIINAGGGPTDDKPTVLLEPPAEPDRVSSFLNIRVADIRAVYEQWTTAAVATTVAVTSGVRGGDQGLAAALRQTAYQVGVALAVALTVSIAASQSRSLLASAHPPSHADALTSGFRLALTLLAAAAALGAGIARVALRRGAPPTPA